jgi:hemerythrin superfamily protein
MRAIDLLVQQHRTVDTLLVRAKAGSGADRIRALGHIAEALTMHAALEEHHIYPLLRQHDLVEDAERSVQEHNEVKELVGQLLELKHTDPKIGHILERLHQLVREHVESEERDLFPRLSARVGEEHLNMLGEQLERMEEQLRGEDLLELAEQRQSPALMQH